MFDTSSCWEITPSSKFHFHEWSDGVVLYLEGEGGTYLLNPFAAELLQWLTDGRLSTQAVIDKTAHHYPDDAFDDIAAVVEKTLSECRSRGFVTISDQ